MVLFMSFGKWASRASRRWMKDTTEIGERELHTVNSWPESLFQLGLGISTCGVSTSTIHDFLTFATSLFLCVLSRLLGVLCSASRKVIECLGDFTRLARTRPVSHELCFIGSSSVSIVNHCSTANAKNGISAAWSRRVCTTCGLGCLIVPYMIQHMGIRRLLPTLHCTTHMPQLLGGEGDS